MNTPSCEVHRGARMLLRPQPVPKLVRADKFEEEEAARRRIWVCRVPGCYRVMSAPALRRPVRHCAGCGKRLSNNNLVEANRCRPCRAKRERQ